MGAGRIVVVLAACAALLACGCGGGVGRPAGRFTPHHPGQLTVLTQPLPIAGFWEGTDARPTGGLELGMARELARRLGLRRVVVRTAPFPDIVAGRLGDADLAMALITPTPARERVLDFTTPYIESPPTLLVRAGTAIPDVQTAQEQRFAVGAGTTFEDLVDDVIRPDTPAARFGDHQAQIDAVREGRADVAVFDLPAAQAVAHRDPGLALAARLAQTEPIAAALPKDSPNTEAVGAALRRMAADGTLDDLGRRWLGAPLRDTATAVPLLRTEQGP